MNKRQKKKSQSKYLPVIADEFNLVTMTDFEKKPKIILDEFHNLIEMNSETYKIEMIDLTDLSKAGKFNPFNEDSIIIKLVLEDKIMKTIIHDFYKRQQIALNLDEADFTDDVECAKFIWHLEQELANKDEYESLSFSETELFCVLLKYSSEQHGHDGHAYSEHAYSEHLVNGFKSVLKDINK